ncbi:hypothetical protein LR48_Vigan08g052400 [Vigna angularis]|uniref:Uncharacterized protein n=1 Tax=Phaseolus angularis TaxID=3914 RepID=A0A0L9V428_PHAAN|nr:hypothetical protein LR48_Vigan08g052400 [Vigna angularis]
MEAKLNALEGRIEGRMVAIESTIEELKAETRAVTRKFQAFGRAREQRIRNQHRSSKGSRESVTVGHERRLPENSKEESEEDIGEVRRSWRKHVELPSFEGTQVEKIFDLQSMTEKEKMKFVYRCMEGGLASYWFRFWWKKTRHPTWKTSTYNLTQRFGGMVGKGGTSWGRCNSSSEIVVGMETYRGSSEGSANASGGQEDKEDEYKTMKLQGWVQGRKVWVLIDGKVSHSLISTRLVEELRLKSEDTDNKAPSRG